MLIALVIILGLLLAVLAYRYSKLNRLISDLNHSIAQKKPFLLEKPFGIRGLGPIDELCRSIRQLIEVDSHFSKLSGDTLPQLEAALENMQESVLIVDTANFVVMANEAARQLLSEGKGLQGKRLEQVLRSAKFLDYVNSVKSGAIMGRQEIEVNRGTELTWFEVSGSPIAGLGDQNDELTIFVLHDISRLKHLEKLRKEFVANVSHELKTPLTVIKGYSETLVEDHHELPVKARQRFLVKILKSVQRLHLLIEDLLTLSRLESGPDKLKRMPHLLPNLVGDLAENFESRLEPGLQSIELEFDPRITYVHVDGVRISQAFENLIDNAFRYAGDFTLVRVGMQLLDGQKRILCFVEDDGLGIPAKDLPHIFE
ncbi:MAG: PAS domain-containing protein, partial [Pirellulales bacterium]|nr:PAS domain-containing protein [Pirellulales bacterium]